MDAERFKEIFLPFHAKLYRLAYRYLENEKDAEDMVQETYIKLWQKRNGMNLISCHESYAVTMLKNTCLDFIRKLKPEISEIYESAGTADSPETRIEAKDGLIHVGRIIEQLPEKQKQLIRWRFWENRSDSEIEKMSGLSRGNIKMIISRARKYIKERYLQIEKAKNKQSV